MGSGHVRPPHIKIRAHVPWTTQVRGIRAANPEGWLVATVFQKQVCFLSLFPLFREWPRPASLQPGGAGGMNSGSLPRGVETQLTGGGGAALALCAVSLFWFSLDFALIVSDYLMLFYF